MKRTISILLLMFLALFVNANEIDKLITKDDVQKFLAAQFGIPWHNSGSPAPAVSVFFKVDIDNNGLTDLLVKLDSCFAVLDTGSGNYDIRRIYAGEMESYDLIDVIEIKNVPLLVVRSWPYEVHRQYNRATQDDTLIFKFGDFIEYNTHPPKADVEEIYFKIGNGYPGRVWDLKIKADGWTTFESEHARNIFAGLVDSSTLRTLIQTINYIDIPALIERETKKGPGGPSTMPTDTEVFTLVVKYKKEKPIEIYDLGGQATYGLKNLYRQLFFIAEHLPELR